MQVWAVRCAQCKVLWLNSFWGKFAFHPLQSDTLLIWNFQYKSSHFHVRRYRDGFWRWKSSPLTLGSEELISMTIYGIYTHFIEALVHVCIPEATRNDWRLILVTGYVVVMVQDKKKRKEENVMMNSFSLFSLLDRCVVVYTFSTF